MLGKIHNNPPVLNPKQGNSEMAGGRTGICTNSFLWLLSHLRMWNYGEWSISFAIDFHSIYFEPKSILSSLYFQRFFEAQSEANDCRILSIVKGEIWQEIWWANSMLANVFSYSHNGGSRMETAISRKLKTSLFQFVYYYYYYYYCYYSLMTMQWIFS